MPFASLAQARFLHAHPDKVGGEAALKEWDSATDWSDLPKKKKFSEHAAQRAKEGNNG